MEKAIAATGITIVKSKSTLNGTKGVMTADHVGGYHQHSAGEKVKARVAAAAPAPAVQRVSLPKSLPLPDEEDVRVVSLDEYGEAALCLAEAFAKDLVVRYFFDTPDCAHWTEAEKWTLHVQILEYITYAHILKGLVTTVGPNFGAVALWMPPGAHMDDLLTLFRSGLWRLNYQLSAEGKKRFFNEFMPLLHDTKAATMGTRDDDSWYLVYIGTRAEARGKGYARKLIEHVTNMADEQGRACYLESSNPNNPQIYRKYGFEERRTVHLQRAEKDIQLDIMVREPELPKRQTPEAEKK